MPRKKDNILAYVNPTLAAQWHPTKNGTLRPTDVTAGSAKKVWWICEKGHEWQITVNSRHCSHTGCPYCAGQKALSGESDLATLNPTLAAQWHPTKNGTLRPTNVTTGSAKKVWWICEKGHEWQTTVKSRHYSHTGCPYCAGKKALSGENDLATLNPTLAAQWHPTKNGDLKPTDVTVCSNKKVWWICEKGHDWQAVIASRTNGTGCPYCSGLVTKPGESDLATRNPILAAQWHPTKNGDLKPTDVAAGSSKKVWWRGKCGHEWLATIATRHNNHTGCPYCAKKKVFSGENDLATINPALAAQWHPTKNDDLKPTDVAAGSRKKVWWRGKCGHEWLATIAARHSNHTGCPYCAGKKALSGENDLATVNPTLAAQWHPTKNGDLKPTDVTVGSNKKVWWICEKGHEWPAVIESRHYNHTGCPYCSREKRRNPKPQTP